MLDEIWEWFSDLEGDTLGWALLIWAVCMLILWKLTYTKIMDFWPQVIVSVIMLPICIIIMVFMANR